MPVFTSTFRHVRIKLFEKKVRYHKCLIQETCLNAHNCKSRFMFTICSKLLPGLFAVTFLGSYYTKLTSARRVKRILSNFLKREIVVLMMLSKDWYLILIPVNIIVEQTKLLFR